MWCGVVCMCVCYRGAGKVVYLDEGEEMEAVLQSKQNEQRHLCVSIYVSFPIELSLKNPPTGLYIFLSLSPGIYHRGGVRQIYKHVLAFVFGAGT